MALSIRFSKSFPCIFCARRFLRDETIDLAIPFHQQIRGKKKKAKPTGTISVKLLEDIIGYGRQGSVIPVPPGRMRNLLYPRQKAAYVTEAQLRELKDQNIVIERDFSFGVKRSEDEPTSELPIDDGEIPMDVRAQLLTPERATQILSATLPASLVFYRSPIRQPASEIPVPVEPPVPFPQQHLSIAAMEAAKAPVIIYPQPISIYGSVTTADVAESVKAALANTEEGARVVLGADDVKIIRTEEESDGETDRFKTLGEFQVEIQVKGGEAITRTVHIKAQES